MTAPVASAWSGCRVALAPTRKRRLVMAHTLNGHGSRWLSTTKISKPGRPAECAAESGRQNLNFEAEFMIACLLEAEGWRLRFVPPANHFN